MGSDAKEDTFASLFESQAAKPPRRARALHIGDKIEAVVVRVGKDSVFVELDDKQAGLHRHGRASFLGR